MTVPAAPLSIEALEERLAAPTARAIESISACDGDIVVLGAGGKMGPSLAVMARRAADVAGTPRRVLAVSRFTSPEAAHYLESHGVIVVRADLAEPASYQRLPDAPNVVFMAGQKFGTAEAPERTWFTNTVIPAFAAARYRQSRMVAFSTGNVYPLTAVERGGSREGDHLAPVGEYAMSCLGRERVLWHASAAWGLRCAILRLNYAVDLRYGVLVDIAQRVLAGTPVDVRMGWMNCIWQGDANAAALCALSACSTPPTIVNVTGPETLSVREVTMAIAARLGRVASFTGVEGPDALLSDTGRMQQLWGPPTVSAATLVDWVVAWLASGGVTSGKATRFEQREGVF